MSIVFKNKVNIKGKVTMGSAPSGPDWGNLLEQKVQASDIQSSDVFGNSASVSSDGLTAIVGSPGEDTGGGDAGAAYIFTRSGSVWTEQQKIQASDTQMNDQFGLAVSISSAGNTAIVGALGEGTGGSNAGAAYIFTRSGNTWTEQQKIQSSGIQADDNFGTSVSISYDGDTLIVGAYNEGTGGDGAGAAYIFTRSGSTWTEQQKIQASDKEAYDGFGNSVSISADGSTLLAGSPGESTGASGAGSAYFYM